MGKVKAYKIVFEDLMNVDLFKGIYDAKNGDKHFMNGVASVMENIALSISEDTYNNFVELFCKNLIESEEKVNGNT